MIVDRQKILATGSDVIRQEGECLLKMSERLGNEFLRAVEIILEPGRRVAVSGMGKSGHVGRKIAATLASTGTPAYFLHPAEAGHGDLGMVGENDALLAISNSGSSRELSTVVRFAMGHSLPVITITSDPESPLGKNADILLLLEYPAEAGHLGCAPTTSTTATLALGDALAMALLAARGFSHDDFNELHPGGALGLSLAPVGSIMHTGCAIPLVPLDADIPHVLLEMTTKSLGCTGVTDARHNLVGIITDGDLRRHQQGGAPLMGKAGDIMTHSPRSVEAGCPVSRALGIMNRHGITSLFIVNGNQPQGIVHMHDCLKLKAQA